MSDKEEFLKKVQKMSLEDLLKYENAAKVTNNLVGVLAIVLILIALFFPNMILVCFTAKQ